MINSLTHTFFRTTIENNGWLSSAGDALLDPLMERNVSVGNDSYQINQLQVVEAARSEWHPFPYQWRSVSDLSSPTAIASPPIVKYLSREAFNALRGYCSQGIQWIR